MSKTTIHDSIRVLTDSVREAEADVLTADLLYQDEGTIDALNLAIDERVRRNKLQAGLDALRAKMEADHYASLAKPKAKRKKIKEIKR